MTITDYLAIIATIIGSASLALQFYKTWKEKTRLNFTIERSSFSLPSPPSLAMYVIGFQILINNEGKRSTTIHSATISFPNANATFSRNIEITNDNMVKSDSTQRIHPQFWIRPDEIQIQGDLKDVHLTIHYTHGKKELKFRTIPSS